ncbi:hypothetical protein BJX68DRAFT_249490 [Aspergillus pseudodeflectus]|uniref:MmgE/PrpD family protein n=1 Tax=Aspergillus pseudodeflectus TaxID=176178 RepID=A0ABR4JDK7_9EURO
MSEKTASTKVLSRHSRALVEWAVGLTFEDLPGDVVDRTKDFFVDWLGCAIAGREHISVKSMVEYAKAMGPVSGNCELVGFPDFRTSPAFAALVNAASSHVVEQDDLHNSSMMHPATIVFPTALAVAREVGASGKDFITACVVGYEFTCRTGEFLGKAHYEKFHTTATTGIIGAAAIAAYLLRLHVDQFESAIGTAGTQASGLWQFLTDATHAKQVHTAHACAGGVFSAYVAKSGLLGSVEILEGTRGMAATLGSEDPQPKYLDDALGQKWSVLGSSFKWHASCRHTHPSVDALIGLMKDEKLNHRDIESITSHTYKAAINVLSLSAAGQTVHQSKFSMGFVLAVAAKYGMARISDFTEDALLDSELRDLQSRVSMVLDPTIDAVFPEKWLGRLIVTTRDGRTLTRGVDVVKGDPEWPLTRGEIQSKAISLGKYGHVQDLDVFKRTIGRVWDLESQSPLDIFSFA